MEQQKTIIIVLSNVITKVGYGDKRQVCLSKEHMDTVYSFVGECLGILPKLKSVQDPCDINLSGNRGDW